MLLVQAQKQRIAPPQLSIAPAITGRTAMVLKIETRFIQIFGAGEGKTLIILSQQRDIDIVIPGDKAAVPYSAQQSSGDHTVAYVVFAANAINFTQDFQLRELDLPQFLRAQIFLFDMAEPLSSWNAAILSRTIAEQIQPILVIGDQDGVPKLLLGTAAFSRRRDSSFRFVLRKALQLAAPDADDRNPSENTHLIGMVVSVNPAENGVFPFCGHVLKAAEHDPTEADILTPHVKLRQRRHMRKNQNAPGVREPAQGEKEPDSFQPRKTIAFFLLRVEGIEKIQAQTMCFQIHMIIGLFSPEIPGCAFPLLHLFGIPTEIILIVIAQTEINRTSKAAKTIEHTGSQVLCLPQGADSVGQIAEMDKQLRLDQRGALSEAAQRIVPIAAHTTMGIRQKEKAETFRELSCTYAFR